MVTRAARRVRGFRATILAVVALSALLLGIVAMHGSMVQHRPAAAPEHASAAAPMAAAVGEQASAGPRWDQAMRHPMGDMDLADCLIAGMLCFLTAAAMLVLVVMIARLRGLLRPRMAARSLARVLRGLRPPEPPSLLALSISRT